MKANYYYVTPFGDDLATVTGKSAARGRDSVHNLRLERREMLKRLAELRALAERRWKANKGLLATVERLHDDAVENARHFKMALYIANNDKQSLLSTIEHLQAENARLQKENELAKSDCWFSLLFAENERLQSENREQAAKLQAAAEYEKEIRKRLNGISKLGKRLSRLFEKQSKRLHDCRADRRKWRDTAERCFTAAMKNAVALADERKGERGA